MCGVSVRVCGATAWYAQTCTHALPACTVSTVLKRERDRRPDRELAGGQVEEAVHAAMRPDLHTPESLTAAVARHLDALASEAGGGASSEADQRG
jgi:hypothetical protein